MARAEEATWIRPGGVRLRDPVVFCADVGSVKAGNFGWARGCPGEDSFLCAESMDGLVEAVAEGLQAGKFVALGFECPLFVPVRARPEELTSGRQGEGNRPCWSAGAGSVSLAVDLPQVVWVLREVRVRLSEDLPVSVRWPDKADEPPGLFLWEAFVSQGVKAQGESPGVHALDAQVAIEAFLEALPDPSRANAIHEAAVHSLLGAALLRTEWRRDVGGLAEACLVIRA